MMILLRELAGLFVDDGTLARLTPTDTTSSSSVAKLEIFEAPVFKFGCL
jgi:hypothetical protein